MSGEEPATQIEPIESPQMVSTVKLYPHEVILNGDGPIQVTTNENGIETEVPPKTAQALLQRQRQRKGKSILLLAIPDEYQLRFHGIKDAKSLWAAINSRFGGNDESKKMQKTVLKQKFENFTVSDIEGLDKAYDRNGDTGYRSRDNTRRIVSVEDLQMQFVGSGNALIVQDGLGYDWSYIAQDEPTEFALMGPHSNSTGVLTQRAKKSVEATVSCSLVNHDKVVYEKNLQS
ncbi:hypothetical protein Tco_1239062 [Tanacetum coccineum]